MSDAVETFLPPTPSEVFEVVTPTMADVDYFFGEASKLLRNHETAKSLLAGQSLKIDVDKTLYKVYGDEILNRFTEQGWQAEWAEWGTGVHVVGDTKTLYIKFERKSYEPPKDDITVSWGDEKRVIHTTGIWAKVEFWLVALWLRWQLWRGIKDENGT